jgi:hypothetical protein
MIDAGDISIWNHNEIISFFKVMEGSKGEPDLNKTTDISMSNKYPSMRYSKNT